MAKNPLFELSEAGTSVWLDYIRRSLMTSGELQRMIDEDAVVGMTSNPTIFEKAIGGSSDYDDALSQLVDGGKSDEEIMLSLIIEDIQSAADVLKPVYEKTKHKDGYVSIEVLPRVAYDTQGTIRMAHDLFGRVGRPNILVKIPATTEGLPAIEQCIADGININITLMFSVQVYQEVARAFIRGLQRRRKQGQPVDIASVASFFVSRVDTSVDKLLEQKIAMATDPSERERLQRLLGKAAVANAKMAYQAFQRIFNEPEFSELKQAGASVQRCLWASTGTKNPHYSDVLYVEELIGPETVNTMPQQTMMAFKEHGEVRPSLLENVEGARQVLRELAAIGIDMDKVTYDLQVDGVKLFADSITKLLEEIANKKQQLKGGLVGAHEAQLGAIEGAVTARLTQLEQQAVVRRISEKDAGLWKSNGSVEKEIRDRLGWLQVADRMEERVPELDALRKELVGEGFTDVVLMGMGGSSLAPEVFRQTFGVPKGALDVHVLDTTDPAAIAALEKSIDLKKSVFIVASKSGTTLETLSHYQYFFQQTGQQPSQFIAITDPGTPLADEAHQRGFRKTFLNPADIGGRYSALSYFGLVPAALGGVDLATLLDRTATMTHACSPSVPVAENPGAWLGAVFAEAAKVGRDKITIIAPPPLQSFGLWAEQLIAESTGKEGKGLVPVADEALGSPEVYGNDRLFVRLEVQAPSPALATRGREDDAWKRLADAGHPVVTLKLQDSLALGAEFFRWEYAIAVAGAILGINVFDQPNVQEAKDLTKQVLSEGNPPTVGEGIRWAGQQGSTLDAAVQALLAQVRPGDYVALLAYIAPDAEHDRALTAIRLAIRDKYRVATTLGYGPRYLHSTGQLHKGGPNTGVFLELVGDDPNDITIPGQKFSFGVLKQAQALGDFQALRNHGRRVLRVQVRDVAQGLTKIGQALGVPVG
ncbi:MAG TPA: bifunctional transaldolase/phosoglucose isomerase, partial [Candidatus Dormibacteraeota bacterium]|nr:bifunctional transaldolase/phosoglucose isomerase [Candidatus Dormibacteraeota bacterium]